LIIFLVCKYQVFQSTITVKHVLLEHPGDRSSGVSVGVYFPFQIISISQCVFSKLV